MIDGDVSLQETAQLVIANFRKKAPQKWNSLIRADLVASHQSFMRSQNIQDMLTFLQKNGAFEVPSFTEAV